MMETSHRSIEIPLHSGDEVIEVSLDQLPDGQEVLAILQQEKCPLHIWVTLALEYYRQGKDKDFVEILKTASDEINSQRQQGHHTTTQRAQENDQMRCLDTLAAYYVKRGHREKSKDKKREYFTKATLLYTHADKILMYDLNHLLGRAYICLLEGDKMEQAEQQFNFVLNQMQNNIPALLGRACISFNKKDYRQALNLYKRALKYTPSNSVGILVGLGHSFAKMNRLEKANLSFKRAIEIDPKCVAALVGQAILEINTTTSEAIRNGVTKLSQAYQYDPQNPMVLNHLANHFFFRKDYSRVRQLAMHALNYTENEAIRAESCYHLARAYHAERDYQEAFRYYYQATHLAPEKFVLPLFGLGQMYLQREETTSASDCFEKILKTHPDDHESMKILASIYAESTDPDKREKAREYLKKVTQHDNDDIDSWIQYAEILEGFDLQSSLDAYLKASKLILDHHHKDIPMEMLNNMGALHFRLNDYEESRKCFERGIVYAEQAREVEPAYANSILVTMRYNLARVYEASFEFDKAETLYKEILREHPKYVDCVLRLGCMARDRGQIYSASDWFKDALEINPNSPDAWTMIGNLHAAKQEWRPGQKKFERILHNPQTDKDAYALISLGNIWLQTLYMQSRDKEREKRHQGRALQVYKGVLKHDNRNIWAANGVGCVLAHKGYLNEARDIFAQVREATADMPDVWLNIAHIYVEQKQYIPAVQMYENCLKKFYKYHNVEVLTYLARALVKGNRLHEAHNVLLNARRVAPHDLTLMFNIALVQQKLAQEILKDENSTLTLVLQAVDHLKISHQTFLWLSTNAEPHRIDLNLASQEAQKCSDLLQQSNYHQQRAQKKDQEDQLIRQKQDEERRKIREKQLQEEEERRRREDERRRVERERRAEFAERTRKILTDFESSATTEKASRSTGASRKKARQDEQTGEFINDSDDLINNTEKTRRKRRRKSGENEEKRERKSSKKRKTEARTDSENDGNETKKRKKKSSRKKQTVSVAISDDDEGQENPSADDQGSEQEDKPKRKSSSTKSKNRSKRSAPSKSSEASGRYKSKETISSSDEDSDDEKRKPIIAQADDEQEEEEEEEGEEQEEEQEGDEEEEQEGEGEESQESPNADDDQVEDDENQEEQAPEDLDVSDGD